ncbi:hypothetical protein L4Z64_001498 [Pseudomonas aeruginosa]|nr:hypothetical protein [Pseudomonas aeruginosa]
MNKVSILALTLIGCVLQANAAAKAIEPLPVPDIPVPESISKLEPGDLITATFVSKDALRGIRAGGPEVMNVLGDGGCKLIVSTEVTADGFEEIPGAMSSSKNPAANVSPRLLSCKGFDKALAVEDNLARARANVGSSAQTTLEFIVVRPIVGSFRLGSN